MSDRPIPFDLPADVLRHQILDAAESLGLSLPLLCVQGDVVWFGRFDGGHALTAFNARVLPGGVRYQGNCTHVEYGFGISATGGAPVRSEQDLRQIVYRVLIRWTDSRLAKWRDADHESDHGGSLR